MSDIDANPTSGTSISFDDYTTPTLLDALHRALRLYKNQASWPTNVLRAMEYDLRRSASTGKYSGLYRNVLRLPSAKIWAVAPVPKEPSQYIQSVSESEFHGGEVEHARQKGKGAYTTDKLLHAASHCFGTLQQNHPHSPIQTHSEKKVSL